MTPFLAGLCELTRGLRGGGRLVAKVEIKEDLDVEVRQLSWIASGDAS
jgi:hypothetical protein